MAATSGVAGGISSTTSLGNSYLGMVSSVQQQQHHQQSYTVPYCASPYSPLPPPPATPHYPPPPIQPQASSASLVNEAPLDLAIKQRNAKSPLIDNDWKEDDTKMEVDTVRENEQEIIKTQLDASVKSATVEVSTQDDLTHRCAHCGIYFLDEVMYALHMSCHGDQAPYQCGFCLHVCTDKYDFTMHIQRGLHSDKTPQPKPENTVSSESADVEEKSEDPIKDASVEDEPEEESTTGSEVEDKQDQDQEGGEEQGSETGPDSVATSPTVAISKSKKGDKNLESI